MADRRLEHPRPPVLPCIFLSGPIIVLPVLSVTIPVADHLVRPLTKLAQISDYPIVGVFPFAGVDTVHEWGCAARVMRIARPSGLSSSTKQQYILTLQGLSRIKLANPPPASPNPQGDLEEYGVTYPSVESESDLPSKDVVLAFRQAALRLLDRLDLEDAQQSGPGSRHRSDVWRRLRSLTQDVNPQGAVWLADMVMGLINSDWEDKLAFLSVPDVEGRLKKAAEIFNKRADISEVVTKISQDVGESLSRQQKELFLRQQLQAIQRELARLARGNHPGSPMTGGSSGDSMRSSGSSDLDDDQDDGDELSDLKKKIEMMAVGSEERKMGVREWKRLKRIPPGSVENGVIRNYLEWLTSLPWPGVRWANTDQSQPTTPIPVLRDPSFLTNARAQLDADHYGLDKLKRRLVEYLAVIRLKELSANREPNTAPTAEEAAGDPATSTPTLNPANEARLQRNKGPILLLVGPPGCGKTSIAQSIATALHRPFQRISLGGVRDEAEIRGHRRTYVASGPGAIIQALRKAGRSDMLLLLDEIDKVGHNNFHGDPSAALLEVLDPEQNHTFTDHYINVPVDLSQILFIATANSLDTISAPLLDRCEVIYLSGYTHDEKIHIANRFLLPKQLKANGLPSDHLHITDAALLYIASRYTREAGVRSLERHVGSVVRFKAVQWADSNQQFSGSGVTASYDSAPGYQKVVDVQDLQEILGLEWWDPEERDRVDRKGIVNGMVVQGEGEGGILTVETILVPGTGKLKLTGSLGDVLRESGELALSWVKSNAYSLRITTSVTDDPLLHPDPIDVHLHLPAGAQKKDGPSAGIAIICALVSLLTGAIIPSNVAMTGEVTLRGLVTPIGGVKEKVLGAHRAGITKVILPRRNQKHVEHELGSHPLRHEIDIVFVSTVREALDAAFGPGVLSWRDGNPGFIAESRL